MPISEDVIAQPGRKVNNLHKFVKLYLPFSGESTYGAQPFVHFHKQRIQIMIKHTKCPPAVLPEG
jgi:hypothetical protein